MFGEVEGIGEEIDESEAGPVVQKTQRNREVESDTEVDAEHADVFRSEWTSVNYCQRVLQRYFALWRAWMVLRTVLDYDV